ncbi:MAG: MFS transporter [Desulfobacteraceae bacterium]|mgnify:CR=1 FL=1|nr:MAG: MFS transporter [Desulfobacteraceae bacterium]
MDSIKDTYFRQNAAGVALVEFFWGLGFPVIMESTFLQIFLKKVGASDFLIGLVPSILILGISVFPLLSSYLTRNRRSKRTIVLGLHVVSSVSTIFFGLFLMTAKSSAMILPVFFVSYSIFSICIGLTFPVWLNFLVKIFSRGKNIKGLSIMMIAQNIAKIISALFILKIVESFAMSIRSAAWIFLCSGLIFLIGSFCFLITREIEDQEEPDPVKTNQNNADGFIRHIWRTIREIIRNRNLLIFLIGDMDNYVTITTIAFYANYATQYFGISPATAAGLFVCLIYTGAIFANVTLGTLDMLSLKQKYVATKILCMVQLGILISMPSLAGFLAASALMGICRGTRSMIYSPSIKAFAQKEDVTAYFAVAPLLTIAFGSGFPALFGRVLDQFSHLGAAIYQVMFGISIVLVFITLCFALLTNFENVKKC